MSISPRSKLISNVGAWKTLLVLIAAGWLGAGAAHAQINDISQQNGVNTTTSLSPGVDLTNIHRDFDPTKKLRKPLDATGNEARLDTSPAARTKGRVKPDLEAVAASTVRSQVDGRTSAKERADDTRNRALLKKDLNAAGNSPRGGKRAGSRGEGSVSERRGALLEPMAETGK